MTEEKMNPPCKCMVEDMRIRGMSNKRQRLHIHIWAIKDYGIFLSHSPDTATPEELRACQLDLTDSGVTPTTFNIHLDRHFFGAFFFIKCKYRSEFSLRYEICQFGMSKFLYVMSYCRCSTKVKVFYTCQK